MLIIIFPSFGVYKPKISFARVVLPPPVSPTRATVSPFLISRLIFFNITLPAPYLKETFLRDISPSIVKSLRLLFKYDIFGWYESKVSFNNLWKFSM